MEEEFLKRYTDCVYFLASPLTCKKGFDCEFRHSEMARLNPRDCWYWLSGSCFNPTCAFRHPPLDVHAQVSSDAANKTNLPCYFYFNGFCNKGDRCTFLHGHDDSAITGNVLKTSAPPLEHKTSVENGAGATQTETHPNPSKSVPNPGKDTGVPLKVDLQHSVPKTTIKKSVSPKTDVFGLGQADSVRSQPLLLKEGITQTRFPSCSEESSEEQSDDQVEPDEPEEKWESSPGFDVLVDNKSEDMGYENDSEYPLAPEGEGGEYFSYDHEDSVQHETRYPDVEFSYDRDVYDAYQGSDSELILGSVRNHSAHPRDRRLDSIYFERRRRLVDVDLRDYLSKDNISLSRSEYPHLISRNLERPQRRIMDRKLSGRLASKVGKHSTESMRGQGGFRNGTNRHGWLKHLEPNRSIKRPYREKRFSRGKSVSFEVSRNPVQRERRSKDASIAFTGPKTLAQIREEKRKTEENSRKTRRYVGIASSDFQGPKPLSEILKDKQRPARIEQNFSS